MHELPDRAFRLTVIPRYFGEPAAALRVRAATGLLYGDTVEQQEHALAAADPLALPWIAAALRRLEEILTGLAP